MDKNFHTLKIPLSLETWEENTINKQMYAHGLLYNAVLKQLKQRSYEYHKTDVFKLKYDTAENKEKKYAKLENLGLSSFDANKIARAYWHSSGNKLFDAFTVDQTAQRAWGSIVMSLPPEDGSLLRG